MPASFQQAARRVNPRLCGGPPSLAGKRSAQRGEAERRRRRWLCPRRNREAASLRARFARLLADFGSPF
jgi:hypothetical protein